MAVRILIADDHAIVREGLRQILVNQPELNVVGEAETGRDAVELAHELVPDIVVIDVGMPELNGVEATRRIVADNPDVKVIALTAYAQKQYVLSILNAGACGYLLKADAGSELLRAIEAARLGRKYLCAQAAQIVVDSYVGGDSPKQSSASEALSSREREILQLVAEGNSSRAIAKSLHLSIKTVEVHRRNVMKKLDLHTVADLVRFAIREGIVPLDD